MAKSANVSVRIEPEIKEEAENILEALGIPVSNAINMFYKQIILQDGIPFEMKLPRNPLDISYMSEKEVDARINKGLNDVEKGKVHLASDVFGNIERQYNL
ncbi:type II toxin-antitoxin system RelB/DinJ family antitoxin [Eubacterium sp.]